MTKLRCALKRYRQLAGLTQEELALRVGIRRETVIRLEAERYNPSIKLALELARAVGAAVEEIYYLEEETS
jgi:DNA-binding XRE family transcriptional regulator